MKTPIRCLLAGTAALVLGVVAAAAPAVGQAAPDFTLVDLDGRTHSLADHRGKVVVLEWVNPECPFVRKHYEGSGNLPETQRAAVAGGAVWLAINSGRRGAQGDFDAPRVRDWQGRTKAAHSAYLRDQDGKVGRLYDARQTPTLYVVDAAGTLVYRGGIDSINSADPGDIPAATNHVKAALADLAAGRPVAQAVTRSYGCSVKY